MSAPALRPRDTLRLFFALWPDDAARAALGDLVSSLRVQCGGRPVPESKLHVTLLFLGNVQAGLVADLRRMAGRVTAPPATLVLDHVEYWRRNRLLCVSATHCPPALVDLVAGLVQGARRLNLPVDERPYVPHVTLLRNAVRRMKQHTFQSITWRVDEFVLLRSAAGRAPAAYETIDRWPLAPAG